MNSDKTYTERATELYGEAEAKASEKMSQYAEALKNGNLSLMQLIREGFAEQHTRLIPLEDPGPEYDGEKSESPGS